MLIGGYVSRRSSSGTIDPLLLLIGPVVETESEGAIDVALEEEFLEEDLEDPLLIEGVCVLLGCALGGEGKGISEGGSLAEEWIESVA